MDKSDQKAFIPTKIDLIGVFVISFSLLLLINVRQFIDVTTRQEELDVSEKTLPMLQDFVFDKLAFVTADATTFLFWLAVGVFGLLFIDSLSFLIRLYRSDLPEENPFHPETYGISSRYIAIHFIVRSVALLGLAGWFTCFIVGALPFLNQLFLEGLKLGPDIYKAFIAALLLQAYFYLAGVLIRFLLLRRKIFLK